MNKLTEQQVRGIVARRERGLTRAQIQEETGIDTNVISAVLSAEGVSKSKPEVRRRDRKRLAKWLGEESANASRRKSTKRKAKAAS